MHFTKALATLLVATGFTVQMVMADDSTTSSPAAKATGKAHHKGMRKFHEGGFSGRMSHGGKEWHKPTGAGWANRPKMTGRPQMAAGFQNKGGKFKGGERKGFERKGGERKGMMHKGADAAAAADEASATETQAPTSVEAPALARRVASTSCTGGVVQKRVPTQTPCSSTLVKKVRRDTDSTKEAP
ncbi:hypothetical protein AA313_de0204429 [Arthrobotrys entomopaga]|nr:hypothetical protein AA313_de0204429 [Arthrobotrys entomopaga]